MLNPRRKRRVEESMRTAGAQSSPKKHARPFTVDARRFAKKETLASMSLLLVYTTYYKKNENENEKKTMLDSTFAQNVEWSFAHNAWVPGFLGCRRGTSRFVPFSS